MKVVVLGGSGFLGSHVADVLSQKGYEVIIFDRKRSKCLKKKQKMLIGNILDITSLKKAIRGSQIVYNFAALADIGVAKYKPIETIKINILGTLNALSVSKNCNVKRFIQASTIYANSEEGGFYARSKKAAEDYIEEFEKIYGLDYTILRFGSLYGERADGSNGVRNMIESAIRERKLIYRGGKNALRRYIHIKDAAKACVKILNRKYRNKYLIITGNQQVKVYKIFNFLSDYFKIPRKKIKFLNEENTGHYHEKPTSFKLREGTNYIIKKQKNFRENLIKLINDYRTSN